MSRTKAELAEAVQILRHSLHALDQASITLLAAAYVVAAREAGLSVMDAMEGVLDDEDKQTLSEMGLLK